MKIRTLIAATLSAALSLTAIAHAATLTVEIHGVSAASGILSAKVAGSADEHDGKVKHTAGQRINVSAKGTVTLRFADLAPGNYAISVMHDENGNGKLDSNILGIPKEAYGFSNNPRVMRKPTYDEAKFELGSSDKTVRIDLL